MEHNASSLTIADYIVPLWQLQNRRICSVSAKLRDEDFHREIAAGRNTAQYIFGHLIASNDGLLPVFHFGERLFPSYKTIYIDQPDRSGQAFPAIASLRANWITLNDLLSAKFAPLSPGDWQSTQVSYLLSIINHQAYHLGQLILLL